MRRAVIRLGSTVLCTCEHLLKFFFLRGDMTAEEALLRLRLARGALYRGLSFSTIGAAPDKHRKK